MHGLLSLFPLEGVYYEVIAAPCGARYTMPLGVVREDVALQFRVYQDAGLAKILDRRRLRLLLLAPKDPLLYLESIEHKLEKRLLYRGGCPEPDPDLGAWVECITSYLGTQGGVHLYSCDARRLVGESPGYTRLHGCIVETLVILTKIRAGAPLPALPGGVEAYLEWLSWCIKRSGRGLYDELADSLLRAARKALQDRRSNASGI